MRPFVDEGKCIGGKACFAVRPVDPKVMEIGENKDKGGKLVIVHPETCDFRAARVRACPTGAFQLFKE